MKIERYGLPASFPDLQIHNIKDYEKDYQQRRFQPRFKDWDLTPSNVSVIGTSLA
jgi:hypothetical protein